MDAEAAKAYGVIDKIVTKSPVEIADVSSSSRGLG